MANESSTLRLATEFSGSPQSASTGRVEAMFRENFVFLGRLIRNLGAVDADVDDVVQRAFVVASRRLDDIRPGTERAFLVQTAIRIVSEARRARQRHREVAADVLPDVEDHAPNAEAMADHKRALLRLELMLSAMDLDLRTVFVLFEVEEMTMAEIAALLELPSGTVASRLRRAREDFQNRLAKLRRQGAI